MPTAGHQFYGKPQATQILHQRIQVGAGILHLQAASVSFCRGSACAKFALHCKEQRLLIESKEVPNSQKDTNTQARKQNRHLNFWPCGHRVMSFHGCARGRQPKHRGKWKGHPRKNKINYLHRSLNRFVASKRVQDNRTHYFFGHGHSSGLSPEWREGEREREWRKKGHREGERQRCGCAICKEPLKPKDKQTD